MGARHLPIRPPTALDHPQHPPHLPPPGKEAFGVLAIAIELAAESHHLITPRCRTSACRA